MASIHTRLWEKYGGQCFRCSAVIDEYETRTLVKKRKYEDDPIEITEFKTPGFFARPVIPECRGGDEKAIENLRPLCCPCHMKYNSNELDMDIWLYRMDTDNFIDDLQRYVDGDKIITTFGEVPVGKQTIWQMIDDGDEDEVRRLYAVAKCHLDVVDDIIEYYSWFKPATVIDLTVPEPDWQHSDDEGENCL